MRGTRASLIGAVVGASALAVSGCGATSSTSPTALLTPQIHLTLNPNGIAPLTALATFETNVPAQVRVAVAGTTEVSKLFDQLETQHSVPVLGLYPDRTNTVTLTVIAADGQTLSQTVSLTTPPLPDFLPQIEIDAANPGAMEPGLNLITLLVTDGTGDVPYPMVFDSNGDVRWYLDLSQHRGLCGLPFERAKDGNFVFGCGDSIYEYSVLGALVRQWPLSGYNFHHEIVELPNGNWLASVDKTGSTITTSKGAIPSVEDDVIEVDRQTGKVVQEWDLRNVMDVSRNIDLYVGGDWLHNNGLAYSPKDDSIIVSGRMQGVVKVTRDNRLRWILAPHQGWGNAGSDGSGFDTRPFLLTAVDSDAQPLPRDVEDGLASTGDFDWPWGQHAPLLLPNGRIAVFDNGDFRNFSHDPRHSRAVEYEIDEGASTVRQTWQFGAERGPAMFSQIVSDIDLLPSTQNRLITAGIVNYGSESYSKMIELSYPDNVVAFEATVRFKNSRATGTGQGQFDLVYRGERLFLYP